MEVLINIPDGNYKLIKETAEKEPSNLNYIARKILTGVVLPKGHGKLIDATILRKDFVVSARFNGTWNLGKTRILSHIDNAQTIIEADKEGVNF